MNEENIKNILRETYHEMKDCLAVDKNDCVDLNWVGRKEGYRVNIDISDRSGNFNKEFKSESKIYLARKITAEACRFAEKHIKEYEGKFIVNVAFKESCFEVTVEINSEV